MIRTHFSMLDGFVCWSKSLYARATTWFLYNASTESEPTATLGGRQAKAASSDGRVSSSATRATEFIPRGMFPEMPSSRMPFKNALTG